MQNRVFFPQSAIDQWGMDGKIDLTGPELIVVADARRYKIVEAVRVMAEVTGANDPHKIVGKVKPNAAFEEVGAEILGDSMIIGDNAYDVVPGWMGEPTRPWAEHLDSPERSEARNGKTDPGRAPKSDEELLQRFAEGTLR
jgi:hypothetical protein